MAFAGIWYLVFGIWSMFYALVIRESCDHCRLRPAKLDWNVDRERLLCKLGRGILFSKRQMTLNSKELTIYLHIKVGMGKFSITLCLKTSDQSIAGIGVFKDAHWLQFSKVQRSSAHWN